MRRARFAALAAASAALCFVAGAARAADPPPDDRLKAIEKSIEQNAATEAALARKAAELRAEAGKIRVRAVAVAARAQQHEAALTALEERFAELGAREAAALAALDGRRNQLAVLIGALERIARHPPVALIALPAPPADTVRSALLLRGALPQVEVKARALRADLESLAELREELTAARAGIVDERHKLDEQRTVLAALADDKAALASRTQAERDAAHAKSEKLGAEARDLRDLIARLVESREREAAQREAALRARQERQRPPAAAGRPAPSQAAAVQAGLPVSGRVVLAFGDSDTVGQPARGVSVHTRSSAAVVAPRAGTVVFAGPFQGLGQLLIIEHDEEYHLLLAGFSHIDAAVGDRVSAGEPVGSMDPSEDAKPTLYMELRRNGRPVNPMPWLAAGRTRING